LKPLSRLLTILPIFLVLTSSVFASPGKILRALDPVPNIYFVLLSGTFGQITRTTVTHLVQGRGQVRDVFQDSDVRAFSIETTETMALALSYLPMVVQVEEVGASYASAVNVVPREPAHWNLARVAQRLPLNAAATYTNATRLPAGDALGVLGADAASDLIVYVMDTGVWPEHNEFATNQVIAGPNFSGDDTGTPLNAFTFEFNPYPPGNDPTGKRRNLVAKYLSENAGHGTAVASIVGGITLGLLPSVKIVTVKTHDFSGDSDTERVARGIRWVIADHIARKGANNAISPPAVMNFSNFSATRFFGDDATAVSTIDLLVTSAIVQGITVVASANNFDNTPGVDACSTSPARVPRAITVGALRRAAPSSGTMDYVWRCDQAEDYDSSPTTIFNCDDILRESDFSDETPYRLGSNTGACVDIFAPGAQVFSADLSSNNYPTLDNISRGINVALATEDESAIRHRYLSSGTSFAAPLVAASAAYYLSHHKRASPITVWDYLALNATSAVVNGPSDVTPDLILYSRFGVARSLSPPSAKEADVLDKVITLSLFGQNLGNSNVTVGGQSVSASVTSDALLVNKPIFLSQPGSLSPIAFQKVVGGGLPNILTIFPRGFLVHAIDLQQDFDAVPKRISQGVMDLANTFARYRITGGCAGGNFCGQSVVTRAQMAFRMQSWEYTSKLLPGLDDNQGADGGVGPSRQKRTEV
jgi:hypothetical protein